MFLLLSEIPVFLLAAGKGKNGLLISLAIFCLLIASAQVIQKKKHILLQFNIEYPLSTALITLLLSILFYLRWRDSGRIITLAGLINLPSKQTCLLITLVLAFLSLVGIGNLLKIFLSLISQDDETYAVQNKYIILFIALTALLTMFLNSRCSPFYPFNTWVDPNTMFTVGKGVLKGYVPYRDLYEQKGPLLIFIHTFGAAVSFDTFIGIWFLELAACFAFLILIYKITALYFGKKSLLIIPLTSAVIYSCQAFKAGDLAEEYSLPFFAYALLILVKTLRKSILPSAKEFFLIGLTSGFVFWMKYSLVGFYLGWFLLMLFYAALYHDLGSYIKKLLLIVAGVITISIPIFLYFMIHSATEDLFTAYFYNNIFYYANNQLSFTDKMRIGFSYCKRFISIPLCISIFGLFWQILLRRWKLAINLFITIISMYIFVFFGAVNHIYTSFDLSLYSLFGFWIILDIIDLIPSLTEAVKTQTYSLSLYTLSSGLIILCIVSSNLPFLEFSKEMIMPYQMKKIIEQTGNKNPSILSYKIGDPGVNTVTGSIPNLRYFCHYYNDKLKEIAVEQDQCIKTQCVDYIITITKWEDYYPTFDTYEHQGYLIGRADEVLEFYHYYTPKR
ncbi:MAG: hypothetical protein IJI57_09530 [Flexilinea sp.]|nr:hypothetical protein [Flexilinea sp.]